MTSGSVQIPTEFGVPPPRHLPLDTQSDGPKTLGLDKEEGEGHDASCFPATLAHCMPEKLHFRLAGQITLSACADTHSRATAKEMPIFLKRDITTPV